MALKEISQAALKKLFEERIESSDASNQSYIRELREYLRAAFNRIYFTLNLIRKNYLKSEGDILEIGSFPFFFSTALSELSDDHLTGIVAPDNIWPGHPHSTTKDSVTIKIKDKQYPVNYWKLNVEKDPFPFEDQSFDMVLCAEVLEHLIQSPGSMMREINRVLKPGGILILTTPNGLFWQYIYKLMFYGKWEQYSRYGVYGRHNRMWALNEIDDFLAGNNFRVLESICNYSQVKRLQFPQRNGYSAIDFTQDMFLVFSAFLFSLPVPFLKKKDGDQLYIVARKTGEPKLYSPDYLYSEKFSYNLENGL